MSEPLCLSDFLSCVPVKMRLETEAWFPLSFPSRDFPSKDCRVKSLYDPITTTFETNISNVLDFYEATKTFLGSSALLLL